MELVEKYLYAVGRKLPMKQKNDIIKELRSIIMDNLDDITKGSELTESQIAKVLVDMGSPSEVAKRYRTGPSWLIGPRYYDLYMMIMKIVLAVTFGGYMIAVIVSMFTQSQSFGQILWSFATQLFGIIPGLFTSVGIVTVIFAIIERAVEKPLDIDFGDGEKWNPAKLEPVPSKEEIVKPIESILGIVFSVIALVIFNVYRSKLGIYHTPTWGEGWTMIAIFNQSALDIYIPLWSSIWALSIGLNGWLLGTGKHNTATRIFEMFISAFNVGILFYIANGPKLFETGALIGELAELKPLVDFLINNQTIIFSILAVLTLVGLIVSLVKFIIKKARTI